MGAGLLPTTIHNNKLYFLFGKEGKYEDTAPGLSDFGGGTDNNETFLETAVREGGEEMTGFLGNNSEVRKMLIQYGNYKLDYKSDGHKPYRTHIFPFVYDEYLPHFYNNNQRFLQKRLPAKVFKTTKIFEKAEIKWICIDDIPKMMPHFRFWYRNIIHQILSQKNDIKKFVEKGLKKSTEKKALRGKTVHNRARKNKTKKIF